MCFQERLQRQLLPSLWVQGDSFRREMDNGPSKRMPQIGMCLDIPQRSFHRYFNYQDSDGHLDHVATLVTRNYVLIYFILSYVQFKNHRRTHYT